MVKLWCDHNMESCRLENVNRLKTQRIMAKAKRIRIQEESEGVKDSTAQRLKVQNNGIWHEDQEECHRV